MASNEKFCLRWNDFETNLSAAFRDIRKSQDFFDCTLSCGSRQIQAHKIVLSACSPFFRSILSQNPHQHPLLYLKGIQFTDLQAVLSFMYNGEVNVAQEELNSFLAVAEDLQVKGLTENITAPTSAKSKKLPKSSSLPLKDEDLSPQIPKFSSLHAGNQDEDEIQELVPIVKLEPDPQEPQQLNQPSEAYLSAPQAQTGAESQIDTVEESFVDGDVFGYEQADGYEGFEGTGMEMGAADTSKGPASFVHRLTAGYSCGFCNKEFRDQSNCRRHVKEKHFGQDKDYCPLCSKLLYKRHMQEHIKRCMPQ